MAPLLLERGGARVAHERLPVDRRRPAVLAEPVDEERDELTAAVDPAPQVVLLTARAGEERAEMMRGHARELGLRAVGRLHDLRLARADAVELDLAVALADPVLDRERVRDRIPDGKPDVPAQQVRAQLRSPPLAPVGERGEEAGERRTAEGAHRLLEHGSRERLERLEVRGVRGDEVAELRLEIPVRVEIGGREESPKRRAAERAVCPGSEVVVGDERVPRVLEIRRALEEDVLHGVDLGAVGAAGFAGAVQPGGAVAYEPDPAPLVLDVERAQELDLGLREV